MSLCIIHVDGSFYSASTSTKKSGLGWGIVAEHDDQTHEACGGYAVSKNQGLNGAHEDIALLHALAYMRNHGFSPQNTHMYCDDQLMGHAPTYLAKENFLGYKAELIERRVTRAAQFIGQEALVPQIMQELQDVCLHKVKGHQGHVYQERVDYLAKYGAHFSVGESPEKLTFEDWLHKGLVVYGPPESTPDIAQGAAVNGGPTASEGPSLVDLGLEDPCVESGSPMTVYKPSVRIQYAPFVRTLDEEAIEPCGPSS